ncbi:MAG: alpha/beta hydrolase [Oscillospiraceae bacterium]|nr:alpha/beta hydrolase [Oscillospiraceae bacterium]
MLVPFISLLVLLLIVLAVSFYIPFYNPTPHKEDPYNIPASEQYIPHGENMRRLVTQLLALPYEQVYITSYDGLRLAAKYFHRNDGAPLKIEFHGFRSAAVRDFCGAHELDVMTGCNVLLVDQRSHGLSDGNVITFGIKERYDVVSWVNYAVERFGPDVKILLSGVSMGAATVLMASSLDLPGNVRGIIADCGYSSPAAIIKKVCREDYHLPVWLLYPFIKLSAKVFGKFDLESASAVEAVKNTNIPLFLVHGGDDRYVPCSMAYEIKEAAGDMAQLHIFQTSGHVLCYLDDTPRYQQLAQAFCDEIFQ